MMVAVYPLRYRSTVWLGTGFGNDESSTASLPMHNCYLCFFNFVICPLMHESLRYDLVILPEIHGQTEFILVESDPFGYLK